MLDVAQSIVHFSAQFKALFCEGLQVGIVMEHGIDPEILDVNRVNGLKNMVLKEIKARKGFRDLNTYGTYLEHLLTPEAKIRLSEQDLAQKDRVIEYFKKIVSIGQAGAKRWISLPTGKVRWTKMISFLDALE